MLKELRRYFLVGLLTLAPLALTVYLLVGLFRWFDGFFQPLIAPLFHQPIPGLGVLIGMCFVILIGIFAPSLFGKQILQFTEQIVRRVPLAKLIYSGTKQIFDSFSQSHLSQFSRVVLVPFPKEGVYAIGFVTHEAEKGWFPAAPQLQVSVFVPTTPNPTGGYLLFFPSKDVIPLNLSVEEALKLVISCGLARPG